MSPRRRRLGELRAAHETLSYRTDPETQQAAVVAVAGRSLDATEAAELLAMLGLLWPPESLSDPQGGPADAALAGLRAKRSPARSGPGTGAG